jgi:PAS domain-containing protein
MFEILVTGREITSKMLPTHELEVSTSRFRSVVDTACDAIITMDRVEVNQRAASARLLRRWKSPARRALR